MRALVVALVCGCTPVSPEVKSEAPVDERPTPGAVQDPDVAAEPPPAADAEPSGAVQPEPAPEAVDWASLSPIRHAEVRQGTLYVSIPEPDGKYARRFKKAYMDYLEFAPHDKRLPKRLTAAPARFVVTARGVVQPGTLKTIGFSSSPMGDNWTLEYDAAGITDAVLAVGGKPVAGASARVAREPTSSEDRDLANVVLGNDVLPDDAFFTVQSLSARLPAGAVRLVSVNFDDEAMDETLGTIATLNADGQRTHVVVDGLKTGEWSQLRFVADLDGDGIDEIGWSSGGIEDESHRLTHFHDGKIEHLELYAAGH